MKTKTELKSNPNAKMAEHMKMWKLGATLVLILGCLAQPALIAANAVIDWNDIASQAIQTAVFGGRPVPVCALDLAMIQAAVYDAVQAIDGRFKPYHVKIPGASGSTAAAAAKAAHDVLVNRLPDQASVPRCGLPQLSNQSRFGAERPRCGRGPAGRCRNNRLAG